MKQRNVATVKRQRKTDSRRFSRFSILEYAMVYEPGTREPLRSMVIDVGVGGLQILARRQFPVGNICEVTIGRADGSRLSVPSEVRFSKAMNGSGLFATGFRFVPETHEQKSDVMKYVHGIFQRQADQLAG